MTAPPLDGLRIVDLSSWVAGAYCTKLLVDGGAQVTKVEAADAADPLRRWSASGAQIPDGVDGALFNFLNVGKQTLAVGDDDLAAVHDLLDRADAVVWSRGSQLVSQASLSPQAIRRAHPGLTVASITPFGLEGPWADKPATEFTLQAWSGAIVGLGRGAPDRPPVQVGGQIGEWIAGVYAAIGTLASLRCEHADGELVDVSMLEAMALSLTYYPVTFYEQLGYPMRRKRFVPTPGVAAAKDALVGLGCGTGQQWYDFCAMVGHPEWTEDPKLFLDRTGLAPVIDDWVAGQTVDEVLDLASAFRIPNAPIVNGENAPTFDHFQHRETFLANPIDGTTNPRPPFRMTKGGTATREPARGGPLPFSGLRVLDMTAFWAGPLVGHLLAMLGAEVIHLESASRPDGARLVGGVPQSEEAFWERGPIFAALNTNKKSVTIDLSSERGGELVRDLIATCDVVIENFTPRVLDQLGLQYDALREVRPDLVMLRMPGFGLAGPWRDRAAFAFVIEDAAGLTWLTGHPDQLPVEPYCVGDPNAGLHALFGLMLALENRDRTGEGSLVEAAMVDAALNVAAEQVIEFSAYGTLLERSGNRGPGAAPQNLYQTAAEDKYDDAWVAIAVATDEQWVALCGAVNNQQWAADAELASAAQRAAHHDRIDDVLQQWCRARTADDVVDILWDAGVPVGKVIQPHHQPALAQLEFRNFFEEVEHPVAAPSRYSTLPIAFSHRPDRWHTRHAPLLGEHNDVLLPELGLTAADLAALEAARVIGRSLTPAGGGH